MSNRRPRATPRDAPARPRGRRARYGTAVALLAALGLAPADAVVVAPGESYDVGFVEKDGTLLGGLLLENLSGQAGEVEAAFVGGPAPTKGVKVPLGFVLLDGTLQIDSEIPAGQVRAQIRIRYDGARVRERVERKLRLLRLRDGGDTWVRARRALRADVDVRFLRDVRADGILGHFGVDRERKIVWGVLDVTSTYAIGALAAIPEPVSYALVVSGLALVGVAARGRRRRVTRPRAA